jgi:hypothetical protein
MKRLPAPREHGKSREQSKAAMTESGLDHHRSNGKAMNIITGGIDLAKNVFAVHGAGERWIGRNLTDTGSDLVPPSYKHRCVGSFIRLRTLAGRDGCRTYQQIHQRWMNAAPSLWLMPKLP